MTFMPKPDAIRATDLPILPIPIIPIVFDYGHKEVRVLEPFFPSDDAENDIAALKTLYKDVKGRFPHSW